MNMARTTLQEGLEREFGIRKYRELLQNQERPVKWQEELNTATIESQTPLIKTVDELLEAGKVDLDVWKVDRQVRKAWPGWAKNEHKDLVFDQGKITGTIQSDGLIVEQLYSVVAYLSRINPIKQFPILQPIECSHSFLEPAALKTKMTGRSLVFADPQIGFRKDMANSSLKPFHDRRALDIALQIAALAQPDRIDILGDFLDLAMWTDKFLRTPEFEYCTQPAIIEAHWWLSLFRNACPNAAISLHEGNHDFRMRSSQMINHRAAYGLKAADELHLPPALSMPKMLALHKLHIQWFGEYPWDEDWLNDEFRLRHGNVARGVPGTTTKKIAQDSDVSEVVGHIHTQEYVSWTPDRRRENHPRVGFCPGCLCHIDGRVPGHKPGQRWQQGCAVVDYEIDGRYFSIAPILIDQGKALWNGDIFKARNVASELTRAYPKYSWGE
jgi:hypothetical protein